MSTFRIYQSTITWLDHCITGGLRRFACTQFVALLWQSGLVQLDRYYACLWFERPGVFLLATSENHGGIRNERSSHGFPIYSCSIFSEGPHTMV